MLAPILFFISPSPSNLGWLFYVLESGGLALFSSVPHDAVFFLPPPPPPFFRPTCLFFPPPHPLIGPLFVDEVGGSPTEPVRARNRFGLPPSFAAVGRCLCFFFLPLFPPFTVKAKIPFFLARCLFNPIISGRITPMVLGSGLCLFPPLSRVPLSSTPHAVAFCAFIFLNRGTAHIPRLCIPTPSSFFSPPSPSLGLFSCLQGFPPLRRARLFF